MAQRSQNEWVTRVLGVDIPAGSAAEAPGADGKHLLAMWHEAKDAVDDGINELVAKMRAIGDPDLDQIADRGLIGVTGGTNVKLVAALRDLGATPPDGRAEAARAVRGAAENYRKTVFAHPMIDLIDDNPWKVKVGLRSRLNAAIETILRETA